MESRKPFAQETTDRIQKLNDQIADLKRCVDKKSAEINRLKDQKKFLKKEFIMKVENLEKEKILLYQKIEELEYKLDHMTKKIEGEGERCNKNCVMRIIHHICQYNLPNVSIVGCESQLRSILTRHAGERIEDEHLKCEKFMDVLEKCEIVEIVFERDDERDEVKSVEEACKKKWEDAWEELETQKASTKEGIFIVGIKLDVAANGGGHCILCDLGKNEFRDAQTNEVDELTKDNFKRYLDDNRVKGIRLYKVIVEKLEEIVNIKYPALHLIKKIPKTSPDSL